MKFKSSRLVMVCSVAVAGSVLLFSGCATKEEAASQQQDCTGDVAMMMGGMGMGTQGTQGTMGTMGGMGTGTMGGMGTGTMGGMGTGTMGGMGTGTVSADGDTTVASGPCDQTTGTN